MTEWDSIRAEQDKHIELSKVREAADKVFRTVNGCYPISLGSYTCRHQNCGDGRWIVYYDYEGRKTDAHVAVAVDMNGRSY